MVRGGCASWINEADVALRMAPRVISKRARRQHREYRPWRRRADGRWAPAAQAMAGGRNGMKWRACANSYQQTARKTLKNNACHQLRCVKTAASRVNIAHISISRLASRWQTSIARWASGTGGGIAAQLISA